MTIEMRLLKRSHLGKEDVYCPFYICDICKKAILNYGNYEYMINLQSGEPLPRTFFTHKQCSETLRIVLPDDLQNTCWMSGELKRFALFLHVDFADTELTTDTPISLYLSTLGLSLSGFVSIESKSLKTSGLYFLFDNDELIYIGKSKNIRQRLRNHHVYRDNYKIRIAPVFDNDLEQIEKGLISLLQPVGNIAHTKK